LAFLAQNEFADRPVDFYANSLGAIVAAQAAIYANESGWQCFKVDQGSHMIFTGPAGLYPQEVIGSLGLRWGDWLVRNYSDQGWCPKFY
jgi:hypothetical protein